jgi:hypothetical protein
MNVGLNFTRNIFYVFNVKGMTMDRNLDVICDNFQEERNYASSIIDRYISLNFAIISL